MPFADILTVVAIGLTVVGLVYAGLQFRGTNRSVRGQFLLALDERFDRHEEIHRRLREHGDWTITGNGPRDSAEWIDVEMYMGLFERIDLLVRDGLLSFTAVDNLYGYRLVSIVRNDVIREKKLIEDVDGWRFFVHLWSELSHIPNGMVARSYPCPTDIQRSVSTPPE